MLGSHFTTKLYSQLISVLINTFNGITTEQNFFQSKEEIHIAKHGGTYV
jgi:hypothetical protein